MFLERLGANECLLGAFLPYAQQQMTLARVAVAQRELYYLLTETGGVQAEASGRLRYGAANAAAMPVTGDWVAARLVGPGQALVEAVLPRRTCLSRRAAGGREVEQPLAANVDVVFLVCGLDGDFNLRRLERYLALAAGGGARPVVALNKADLCADLPARLAETALVARAAPVVAVNTVQPEGTAPLRAFLTPGCTCALLGSSGAGKSSIANCLLGEERFSTQPVRLDDSRGRHTTVRRELTPLPVSGALIDTPGMRELQLWAAPESLDQVFDEIAELAQLCRFRDCTHQGEPGCEVAAAVERGQVDAARWSSFQKLRAEARYHDAMADPLTALDRKRKWKAIHKQARAISKSRH